MSLKYTPQELEQLLSGLNSSTPLYTLGTDLGRSPYGIALKMRDLSKQYPAQWNPEKVAEYTRSEVKKHKGDVIGQKMRWRARRGEKIIYEESTQRYNDSPKFVEYLKDLLGKYNGMKKDLAGELGIHPSQLSHILAGRRRPTDEFLRKMSERFQIPQETLESLVN